ncbi:MAG: nitrophenyl compound nitroreductase subunit ArsF family protein [Candidatus Bipolaricaulota bacterium]|nr:nitrophenyl compound nitroreductase subunit ArsF family protein [Candidatus Bipolaricaulota bacterium]
MEHKTLLIVVLVVAVIAAATVLIARGPDQETARAAEVSTAVPQAEASAATSVLSQGQAAPVVATLQSTQAQTPSALSSPTSVVPTRRVIATYFHNTVRCVTCRSIERIAKETIESTFAAELASGKLVWRALNMQEKENEHYAIDYSLVSPSLVLAEMDGEREVRFKVLTDTWKLAHKEAQFVSYVQTETRAFLEGL